MSATAKIVLFTLTSVALLLAAMRLRPAVPGPATAAASRPSGVGSSGDVRVLTCNVRYSTPDDGVNDWPHRRDLLVHTVLQHDPDVVGCQEVTPTQRAFLISQLQQWYTEYPRPGVGRVSGTDGQGVSGEVAGVLSASASGLDTLFFKTARFEQIDGEAGLVLPNEPQATISENTFYTLAVLRDRAAANRFPDLVVINTHLRHGGAFAERCADRLHAIAAGMQEKFPGAQVIVLGDMNHDRTSPVYAKLLGDPARMQWRDAFDYVAKGAGEKWGTYHGFTGKPDAEWPSDLIFVSQGLSAEGAQILRDSGGGKYPTDHFLVMATVHAGTQRP